MRVRTQKMTTFVGMGMVLAAASVGLVSCGSDTASTNTTTVRVGATNYVTIAPAPSTAVPVTTAPDAPGSVLAYETEYVIQQDDYPSTIANKWKVPFEELMAINNWTLQPNGIVPEWPGVGATIRIPANATVPGVPPDPGPVATTVPGQPAAPTTTPPPTTPPPTTTTTVPEAEACGTYTIEANDYPGLVAQKLNTTVAKLDAANTQTQGYRSFIVGVEINVPC